MVIHYMTGSETLRSWFRILLIGIEISINKNVNNGQSVVGGLSSYCNK